MKIWLIVAAALIVLGLVLFVVVMTLNHWNFGILGTEKYVSNTHEITDDFQSIAVTTKTAVVSFVRSEDGTCRVECYEEEKCQHTVSVQDGTLTIAVSDERAWYNHIGISWEVPRLTVFLPQTEYEMLSVKASTGDISIPADFHFENVEILTDTGDVQNAASATDTIKIKTDTGRIGVENLSAGTLELSVSTGKITAKSICVAGDITVNVSTGKTFLTDVSCRNLISDGSTGDLLMTNVRATERISLERSTGDVHFESCDAAEIAVTTDTGDVSGNLCSDKIFFTKTDTGDIEVPQSMTGGKCEITTDTGDIRIEIKK